MRGFGEQVLAPFREDVAAWRRTGWESHEARPPVGAMLVRYAGLRATLLHRVAFWASSSRIPAIPTLLSQLNLALHGIEMPPGIQIGPGLYMPHTSGTVVAAQSVGSNVTLQGGITVGMRQGHAFPVIGDGAILSAGCRVLGPITVGAGAIVGANAVVIEDVAPNTTVVGVPARPLGRRNGVAAAV